MEQCKYFSESARLRYQKIAIGLANGYLERQILLCRDSFTGVDFAQLQRRREIAPIDEPCH